MCDFSKILLPPLINSDTPFANRTTFPLSLVRRSLKNKYHQTGNCCLVLCYWLCCLSTGLSESYCFMFVYCGERVNSLVANNSEHNKIGSSRPQEEKIFVMWETGKFMKHSRRWRFDVWKYVMGVWQNQQVSFTLCWQILVFWCPKWLLNGFIHQIPLFSITMFWSDI